MKEQIIKDKEIYMEKFKKWVKPYDDTKEIEYHQVISLVSNAFENGFVYGVNAEKRKNLDEQMKINEDFDRAISSVKITSISKK